MVFLGPIAISKVFRQPKSSISLIASAKGLNQPLSSFDTACLEKNPTVPILKTPSSKCAAASTLTKATSTTTCSAFPLSVASTEVPAEHGQKKKERRSRLPAHRAHVFDKYGRFRGIERAGSLVKIASAALVRVLRAANRDGFFAISCAAVAFLAAVPCDNRFLNNAGLHCCHVPCGPG